MPRTIAAAFVAVLFVSTTAMPPIARAQAPNPSFYLVNRGSEPINELFATPAGMENWGKSRNEGHPIVPGARFAVRLRADGNCVYDLKIVFAGGHSETRRHLDTCKANDVMAGLSEDSPAASGAAPAAASQGSDASFRLINRGKSAVTEVYATPANAEKLSDNLLQGGATLAPQASEMFHLTASQGCSYNLRVVFADKQSREKKNTDLCKIADLPVQ